MDRQRSKRTEENLEMQAADKDVEIGNVDNEAKPDIESSKDITNESLKEAECENKTECDIKSECENKADLKTDTYSDTLVIEVNKTDNQKAEIENPTEKS